MQQTRLGVPFRYLEHNPEVRRKFLQSFEKNFNGSKHKVLSTYSVSILGFIFSKSHIFSLFLLHNSIDESYGHDFFTDTKN